MEENPQLPKRPNLGLRLACTTLFHLFLVCIKNEIASGQPYGMLSSFVTMLG